MKIRIIIILLTLICAVNFIFADNSGGSTAGNVLLVIPYSSVNASGNSGVGLANAGWQFIGVNPAHISFIEKKTAGFAHNKYIESTSQQGFTYATKIKKLKVAGTITYFDYGDIRRTTYSVPSGNTDFSANDYIFSLFVQGPENKIFHSGVALKYLKEKIDNYSASAAALDAGIIYTQPENPFSAGLTIQNVGTKLKFESQKEDLPLLVKIGAAYKIFGDIVTAHIDWQKIKGKNSDIQIGAEANIMKYCSLRVGYDSANDASKGITMGFDLNLQNGLELNYSYIPYNDFDNSHKFTVSYSF